MHGRFSSVSFPLCVPRETAQGETSQAALEGAGQTPTGRGERRAPVPKSGALGCQGRWGLWGARTLGRGGVAGGPASPQFNARPFSLCLLNPVGMAVFLAMEIVHFSSFVVLNVGCVQGTLAGQSLLTLLSQEMFLAVGIRDLGSQLVQGTRLGFGPGACASVKPGCLEGATAVCVCG